MTKEKDIKLCEYKKLLEKKSPVNKDSLSESFKKASKKRRIEMYFTLETTDAYNVLN